MAGCVECGSKREKRESKSKISHFFPTKHFPNVSVIVFQTAEVMRFSTNFIPCSVLLLATILVKGVQAQSVDGTDCCDCGEGCGYCNSVNYTGDSCDCCEAACCGVGATYCTPDTCVDPTAVTGVTANATVLTIDGFEATVTCAAGYYDAVGNLGTPIACSSDNTAWTYTGS